MILNTGSRTDIPAFYGEWFLRRIQEGYCLTRNPYYPQQVLRYALDPEVVDLLVFCTKNPAPLLDKLHILKPFCQCWYVTLTPYGRDIEPFVPPVSQVIASIQELSRQVGPGHVIWRYDPILVNERYTVEAHLKAFSEMAGALQGYCHRVVISFLDLYEKTRKNFPQGRQVSPSDQELLAKGISEIASRHGYRVYACLESPSLSRFGIDTGGCMTKQLLESVLGEELIVPSSVAPARQGCSCLLGNDIGAYNTCRHFCKYCYANYDRETVLHNSRLHDPASPLLIGHLRPEDQVREAKASRWRSGQLNLFALS